MFKTSLILSAVCLAATATVLSGCGGNGTGENPHAISVLAFTWTESGTTSNRKIESDSFRAVKGADITFDRDINGIGGAFVLSNPASVPNTQVVFEGFPVPGMKLYIDGFTYVAAPGATIQVTNASGNVSGTFQGSFSSAGQSTKQISGNFTVYY